MHGPILGVLFLSICIGIEADLYYGPEDRDLDKVVWCTVSKEEHRKCQHWALATSENRGAFSGQYFQLRCIQSFNKEDCMVNIDNGNADLTLLDAGEVFEGGRYHSLVPIMQEKIAGDQRRYFAVALIKRGDLPHVSHLSHLRGVRACFAGVGTLAGWVMPLYTLMQLGGMEITDCNNFVKSATSFFGPSCAVNSLIDKNNPIGDNSDKLCNLCIGRVPGEKCSSGDPFAGYEGAFRCLREKGQIAFLKHTTVEEMTRPGADPSGMTKNNFELLCIDGTRRKVDDYRACNWGDVPTHAVVTSSAKTSQERLAYQEFLTTALHLFGRNSSRPLGPNQQGPYRDNDGFSDPYFNRPPGPPGDNPRDPYGPYNRPPQSGNFDYQGRPLSKREAEPHRRSKRQFDPAPDLQNYPYYESSNSDNYKPPLPNDPNDPFFLFVSTPRYGTKLNLLVQDSTEDLISLPEIQQTYALYLDSAMEQIMGIRRCTVNKMTLCVTSDAEMDKCLKMRSALEAHLLKPHMACTRAHSHIGCMNNIRNRAADVTVLDASDVYTAGYRYGLVPFMAEVYNLGEPWYYAVAVAKEQDPTTELTHLKNKNTCHTGINTAAGWVVPMAYLLSNSWIRPYGCDSVRAAAEYFSKSCVPGALSNEYNIGVPYDNMCHLCHGASHRYCSRDASEDYFGHTGAIRCLVEGGGDVAFIKHTTVNEIVDGKRAEWWARNALKGDFQLLCPDGRRAPVDMYQKCNLGKVKSNAIVTRGGSNYNETELNAFINLFVYAQQFNGKREADEFSFSMFSSKEPFSDLIFQDATQQLVVLNYSQRHYASYLGPNFLRARRIVDCHAAAGRLEIKIITLLLPVLIYLLS